MNSESANAIYSEFVSWLAERSEIAWSSRIPAKSADCMPFPEDLSPILVEALHRRGIDALYTHQRKSYDLVRSGHDIIVVTPTASGKTLCYNLPILQTLLEMPNARALYLFPTKALSQDQQSGLNEVMLAGSIGLPVNTYDGDTPSDIRSKARTDGHIIISNPDMLHAGILPNHTKWAKFFSNLKFIVVDELHAYRGIFGSHVASVIRRLLRIAKFYGSSPTFIFSSATIGNPQELAEHYIERKVEIIEENGAGSGEKILVCINPPLVDEVQGLRRSNALEAESVMLWLLQKGVRTILFSRSRLQVELLAHYLNQKLENPYNRNYGIVVKPYRSGLLPSERREIERGLRNGTVHGVVSTNALELGIDIGGLDAAVITGYPGSIASFWQQAGRAGRTSGFSLAVYVASSSPLDQYFVSHPEYFLSRGAEQAHIDTYNPYIFTDHLKCAAFELPFLGGEAFSPDNSNLKATELTSEALEYLEEEGIIRHVEGRYFWSAEGYPGEKISLRSATTENVVIVDISNGHHDVIGEMDRPSAKELLFEKAIYIHLGTQYQVKTLDFEKRICLVELSDADYWTDSIVKRDIELLTEDSTESYGQFRLIIGDILVRSQVEKYKKLRFNTHENIGYGEIWQEPEEMQTRSLMMVIDPHSQSGKFLSQFGIELANSIVYGIANLICQLAPARILCDVHDIGVSSRARDPFFESPVIYFYDMYPGGTGIAEALCSNMSGIISSTFERIASCPCLGGCPSCIGVENANPDTKAASLKLLDLLSCS
ncbi:MAG: DEAD-box ATP-dependent RNA helicase CshA [Spirochaetes bacterium ADurb.Bin110]|nr:MAG: DEAD-box ATP-dependent RNA helicase CshA [Spirochaetes bacterium ADurb.Bin110]